VNRPDVGTDSVGKNVTVQVPHLCAVSSDESKRTSKKADPLVPNRVKENLKLENRGLGEGVWNERVTKVSPGADSENLKMRRLPPTFRLFEL
jgi:hypothetical protein